SWASRIGSWCRAPRGWLHHGSSPRARRAESLAMRPGGPRKESLDHLQFGLHYGIVVQNKDPENLDRIKVRLPWLDNGDVDQTHWAQLVTPMEGKKFGWYTLPDIDDVVVVMFIGGDTSQPVILGGVWSKTD